MMKHIVMWTVRGETATERYAAAATVKREFEGLRNAIPGLERLEIGIDESAVPYACDVVLYSEFRDQDALTAYGSHPNHLAVKDRLEGIRIGRHQVDYSSDEVST